MASIWHYIGIHILTRLEVLRAVGFKRSSERAKPKRTHESPMCASLGGSAS